MNRYNLKEYLHQELAPYHSSFKKTSYDKENQEYLCQDENTKGVYDFDGYIEANKAEYPQGKLPASPDAIYVGRKHLYFVEFKNQFYGGINKGRIQNKFCYGTKILQSMLAEFTPRDCKYYFCVVFKPSSKPKHFDARHFQKTAERFGLDGLNKKCGNFYDKVLTEDIEFFKKEFKQLKC